MNKGYFLLQKKDKFYQKFLKIIFYILLSLVVIGTFVESFNFQNIIDLSISICFLWFLLMYLPRRFTKSEKNKIKKSKMEKKNISNLRSKIIYGLNFPSKITWVIIALSLFALIIALNLNYETNINDAKTTNQMNYIDEELVVILAIFSSDSSLTDLQKDELWNLNYNGRNIKDKIYVHDVDKNMFGTYVVLGDILPRSKYKIGSDVALFFKNSEKNKLLGYSVGDILEFEGKLDSYGGFMSSSININNAIVIE